MTVLKPFKIPHILFKYLTIIKVSKQKDSYNTKNTYGRKWLMMATVIRGENESLESMIKRFKRKVNDDNIMNDLKRREFYLSPSQKRRAKSEAARKRKTNKA